MYESNLVKEIPPSTDQCYTTPASFFRANNLSFLMFHLQPYAFTLTLYNRLDKETVSV